MENQFKLYRKLLIKEMHRRITYRSNIIAGILYAVFTLSVQYGLWSALFATGNAQGSTFNETMTYFVINAIVLTLISTNLGDYIGQDYRSGDIAQKMIKPYPYQLQIGALQHGKALFGIIQSTLPMFILALVLIGLKPPVSFAAFMAFVVTLIFGGMIYFLVDLSISYTAFWLTDYWYLSWFRRALFTLFGGTMLPLWFYPDSLQVICNALPFRYAVYQPMAFYLGRVPFSELGYSIIIQIIWIIVLLIAKRLIWYKSQRRMIVQGG